jgi:hypothetical protein
MNAWWEQLTPLLRIFWCIALFASILQILMFLGSLMGAGHDFDHDVHAAGATGNAGAQILSVRTLVAGMVGFGWSGVLMLQSGADSGVAIGVALLCGVLFMLLVFGVMRFLFSMRADGTLDYKNAVGVTGRVYFTVPAHRSGTGQVEIMLQGRMIVATAETNSLTPLVPQSPVRVSAAESDNTLLVEPV